MGEKTEKPTGRRLGQARSRGQVAKSQDLASSVAMLMAFLVMRNMGPTIVEGLAIGLRDSLAWGLPGDPLSAESMALGMAESLRRGAMLVLPVLVAATLVAGVVQYLQVGPLWTMYPIRPKFNRLNPVSGLKKFIGLKNLQRTGINVLKLIAVMSVCGMVIGSRLDDVAALPRLGLTGGVGMLLKLVTDLGVWIVVVMLLLGIVDLFYQKWQHFRDLKMTKQEVKDERKSLDGDPQVKRRRLRMYMDIVMQRMKSNVPKADVVITNPTHFSVALRYDSATMRAPTVVAKGADFLAFRIREIARAHDVPIVERPPLARALYHGLEPGQQVRPEHYEAVAEVLAYVYRIDTRAGRRRETAAAAAA